ncbi:MAG: hypothetical protein AAB490_01675 [Patescibacteria group bacterium]
MKDLLLLILSLSLAGCWATRQQLPSSAANTNAAPSTGSYDKCLEDCEERFGAVGVYDQLSPSSFGTAEGRDCIENCKATYFPERYVSGQGGSPTEIIPYGQECSVDTDCVCVSNAPDKCGEVGQEWKCVGGLCQLR